MHQGKLCLASIVLTAWRRAANARKFCLIVFCICPELHILLAGVRDEIGFSTQILQDKPKSSTIPINHVSG